MNRASARDGRCARASSSSSRSRRGSGNWSVVVIAIEFVAAPIFLVILVAFFFVFFDLGHRCRNVARTAAAAAGIGTTGVGGREWHRHEFARAHVSARRVCARDARTITRLCVRVCVCGGGGGGGGDDGWIATRKKAERDHDQNIYIIRVRA